MALRTLAIVLALVGAAGCLDSTRSAELSVVKAPTPGAITVALKNTGGASFLATANGFTALSTINSTVYSPQTPRNASEEGVAFPTSLRLAPGASAEGTLFFKATEFPLRLVYDFDNVKAETRVDGPVR